MSNNNTQGGLKEFYSGETNKYKFTFVGIDITGWKIHLVLKDSLEDDEVPVLSTFSTAGDDPLDDPINGVMYVVLNSTVSNIDSGSYYYQFIREIGSETPRNLKLLDKGKVKVPDLFEA